MPANLSETLRENGYTMKDSDVSLRRKLTVAFISRGNIHVSQLTEILRTSTCCPFSLTDSTTSDISFKSCDN